MKTKTTYVLLLVITLLSCGQEPSPDLEGVWYLSNPYRYTEYDFEEVIVSQPQKRDKAPQDTSCYLNYMLPVLEVSDGQGLWNGGSLGRSGWSVSINARERYLEVEKHGDCRYRLHYKIKNDSLWLFDDYGYSRAEEDGMVRFIGEKVEEAHRDGLKEYFAEMQFPLNLPNISEGGTDIAINAEFDIVLFIGTHTLFYELRCHGPREIILLSGDNSFLSLRDIKPLNQYFLEDRDNRLFLIAQKDARQSMMNSVAEEIAQVGLTQRSYLCAIDSRRRGFEQIRWVGIDQIDDLGVMQQFDAE